MLLVLSDPNDPIVHRVGAELVRRHAPFVVLNPAAESLQPTMRCALGWRGSRIRTGDGEVDLDEIHRIWVWRPGVPRDHRDRPIARHGDATVAAYVEGDWVAVFGDALHARPRKWTPAAPATIRRADAKLCQLALAERLGLRVPETLVTNDVEEALAFVTAHSGDVIAKPPSTVATWELMSRGLVAYTRAIKPRDLATIESLGHVPVMFQRRIPKKFEVRATIVGDRVLAAEIHSQSTRRTRVDWRRYDHAHTPVHVHELPADVAARCLSLAHGLGLRYGAIDLVVTPDDEYVFLEINPNGQWAWIEELTGLPITAALCDELEREEVT